MHIAEVKVKSSSSEFQAAGRGIDRANFEEKSKHLGNDDELNSRFSRAHCASLLRNAVIRRDAATVRLLLSRKPELNPTSRTNLLSPLWIAVLYDSVEIAELLVRAGADTNERLGPHSVHDRRSSFLHVLVSSSTASPGSYRRVERLLELLLEHGADLEARDSRGQSALHYAAIMGSTRLVRKLLASRANPDARNHQAETVLHVAAQSGHAEQLVPILLGYGANARARDLNGMNALHYLAKSSKEGLSAAAILINRGVSLHEIEAVNEYKPLHFAVINGKENLVKLFLNHGADVRAKTKTGIFPLYLSAKLEKSSMIRLLVSYGANVNEKTSRGRTPLHWACRNLLEKNIRLLMEFGADVNVKDQEDVTPFSLIEYKNMNPSIKTVIKQFARLKGERRSVNEEDLYIVRQYPKLQKFYERCLNEIARMKEEKFYNSFSFYSILTKRQRQLASLVKNPDFAVAFKTHNLENLFPLYSFDLDLAFKNAEERRDALCATETILYSIFLNYFPHTVIQRILYYLTL